MLKDLQELLNANVISQSTADQITEYYKNKKNKEPNRLIAVFGIVGAILVGMGIILIVAHNWDNFNRFTKSLLAFLPLIAGQILAAYAMIKKKDQKVWIEGTSAFLFFSVGACIAMISQIYHISGELPDFILTWMLLALPQIYIMNSSVASLFYLTGINYYVMEVGYSRFYSLESLIFWVLLIAMIPHYIMLLKKKAESNYAVLHSRLIPISIMIGLGSSAEKNEELMFIAFMSLFSAFLLLGSLPVFHRTSKNTQSFSFFGLLGIVVTLIPLTFDWIWPNLFRSLEPLSVLIRTSELHAVVFTTLAALFLLVRHDHLPLTKHTAIFKFSFIVFIGIFFLAAISPGFSQLLSNLMLLFIGIRIIQNGIAEDHLGILNFGLLVLATAVACKFFDSQLSFVIRGLVFVALGLGFFYTNYLIIKKRKQHEQ
ncbi:MAG: DUF2157 domain-containing protein [Bacteroidetes bacterium]|nr:DUF2157 domain-containing protein [Bacteroidota bacterium]